MSKGLDALERIGEIKVDNDIETFVIKNISEYKTIEKELNALQILKNKQVDIELFMDCDKWEEYVVRCENHADMSKPVYDLLKEVLL